MGNCIYINNTYASESQVNRTYSASFSFIQTYKASGIIFRLSPNHILAGLASKKETGISGIGGKKSVADSSALFTAWRETMEEIFGYFLNNVGEFNDIINAFKPLSIHKQKDSYVLFEYDISTLFRIVSKLRSFRSPFYDVMPQNVQELLFNRKQVLGAEIASLCVIPLTSSIVSVRINPDLLADIGAISRTNRIVKTGGNSTGKSTDNSVPASALASALASVK